MCDMTCRQPDRDCPKLMCGHPLPCPWHTAIIDTTVTPATVTIPVTAKAALAARKTLAEIARAAAGEGERCTDKLT